MIITNEQPLPSLDPFLSVCIAESKEWATNILQQRGNVIFECERGNIYR